MQQTEKRGLNIIERSDAFSPEALNDNTRKIEAALDAYEEKIDAQVSDLDERVKVFEAKKLAFGSYTIQMEQTLSIQVGFTPIALYVCQSRRFTPVHGLCLPGDTVLSPFLKIVEGGFTTYIVDGNIGYPGTYHYIAFG